MVLLPSSRQDSLIRESRQSTVKRFFAHALCLMPLVFFVSGCTEHDAPTGDPTIRASLDAPAMCPWREPEKDLQHFFPGANDYSRDTLILSSLRLEIMKRLGKDVPLESNSLYAYRVHRQKQTCGTILVRRTAGEFGAMEVVLAVNPERQVVGLWLQRHREPPAIARVIEDAKWLGKFTGKKADDDFTIGQGLPVVPPDAEKSATAVAQAVRSLLIEYDVVESSQKTGKH